MAIGTENTDAVTSGTLLTEGTADGMDGPTAFGEAEPGLDELLAGMDQDPEGAATSQDRTAELRSCLAQMNMTKLPEQMTAVP